MCSSYYLLLFNPRYVKLEFGRRLKFTVLLMLSKFRYPSLDAGLLNQRLVDQYINYKRYLSVGKLES